MLILFSIKCTIWAKGDVKNTRKKLDRAIKGVKKLDVHGRLVLRHEIQILCPNRRKQKLPDI
jgi:hypothetical protein